MILEPRCFTRECKHFSGIKQDDGEELTERAVCSAFPDGIPESIAFGSNLHLSPVQGDGGIRYEKKSEEDSDS